MKAIVVTDQAAETAGTTPQKAPVLIPARIRGYGTFSQVRRYVPTVPPAGPRPELRRSVRLQRRLAL